VKGKGASGSFVVVSNAGKTVPKARDRKVSCIALNNTLENLALKHMYLMKCSLASTQAVFSSLLYFSSPSTVIKNLFH